MIQVCWAILLICFYSNSEGTIIVKESGESITLKCSSDRCTQSNDRYAGIYLYHNFTEQNEVCFYSNHNNSEIKERPRYKGRIRKNGTPMNHDITITNLTVDDSGVYACVYKKSVDKSVECNVYTVFVRGVAPCPRLGKYTTEQPKEATPCSREDDLQTLVLIISICVLSMLLIMSFILLIIQWVKQRGGCRKGARSVTQESSDVYEVMNKGNLHPASASEQPSQSPYEFD